MTRKRTPVIHLTGAPCSVSIETGLFVAPVLVRSSGAFVIASDKAKTVRVLIAGSEQEFTVTSSGKLCGYKNSKSDAWWYAVDTSKLTKDSPLSGYAGFCFVGNANAYTAHAEGFIPFGETEVMIDADGNKFLVIGSE